MIPDNVQSPAEFYTLHIDPKGYPRSTRAGKGVFLGLAKVGGGLT